MQPSTRFGPDSNGEYTVVQSGREVHKGLEFTATGKARKDLTIFSGLTFDDPQITKNLANPAYNGTKPTGVSTVSGKMYAEYDLHQ